MPKSQSGNRIIHGVTFPPHFTDFHALLWLYRFAPLLVADPYWRPAGAIDSNPSEIPYDGFGRFQHAKQIAQMLYPKAFEWHSWSDLIVEKACTATSFVSPSARKDKISNMLAISGPGASGKSTGIGLYSLEFWQCSPLDTAVILASKTIESAKKRIWREVFRLYSIFSQVVGGYRDALIGSSPRPFICPVVPSSRKKDEAHGLFVTALHGKELEKEIAYIKGFHPRRILVVADELDSLEEGGKALVDTFIDNLQTGTEEAQFIGLGNDPSLFNALGDMMQPELGKPVTLAHKEWTSAKGVTCLRLDAWDSPNLKDGNKWTGLVRQQDIDNITRNGAEMNSPSVWIQLHGLHPPEGADNTVLSEAAIIRFHCKDKVSWQHSFIASASLDPGFGGDPCVLRTFKRGNDETGKLRVFCDEVIVIPIDAGDKYKPAEYQIAEKVIAICKARSIPPDEFVIGGTGTGRGTPSVLQREWSPRIHICLEGGAPSDLPVSDEDPRPAKLLYDRRVTELWFSIRQFVEADLLRGLDDKTALQLCSRLFSKVGSGGNWKDSIQKKDEMPASPNEADALGFYIDMLRAKGITAVIQSAVKSTTSAALSKHIEELDWDGMPDCYADEFA